MKTVKEWKDELIDETMSCCPEETIGYLRSLINRSRMNWPETEEYKDEENMKQAARELLASICK